VLSVVLFFDVRGQELIVAGNSRYNDTSGGLISNLPTKLTNSVGEVYWFEEPLVAKVQLLNNDSITGYKINLRLDIASVEIFEGNQIKVLPLALVTTITTEASVLITHKSYPDYGNLPQGFYEVLVEGRYSLLKHLHYKIQDQNYNVQFDVGSPNASAIRVEKHYVLCPSHDVIDLTESSRKTVADLFPNPIHTKAFIKSEKIKLKKSDDLIRWIEHENRSVN